MGGGLRSNTPLREVLQAHRDYWLSIAREKEKAILFSENSRLKIMNNNSINALNEIQYQYTEKQRNIQELISTELHLKKIIQIDREIVTRLRQR